MIATELVDSRASEECGCPEEEWLVGGVTAIIHLEEDGHIHCFLDTGDDQAEMDFHGLRDLAEAREPVLGWAKGMLYATRGWGS